MKFKKMLHKARRAYLVPWTATTLTEILMETTDLDLGQGEFEQSFFA